MAIKAGQSGRYVGSGLVLGFGVGVVFGPAMGTWAPMGAVICAGVGLLCGAAFEHLQGSKS